MQGMRPKEMIFDFFNTVFLIFLISFFVFYFIVGEHWSTAEKIVKIAMNLSVFSIFFLAKLKITRHEMKQKKEDKDFDDISVYFSGVDKLKGLFFILSLIILMIIISFFWSFDFNSSFLQIIIVFLFLYFWHLFLFRKRDSISIRMYATVLDVMIDSVIIYFIPVLILSISFFLDYYSFLDVINSLLALSILYLKHKFLFVLNDKK